ncbi:MAG: hypothetical protein Kow0069_24640 [Promethearchaeota archaeon]
MPVGVVVAALGCFLSFVLLPVWLAAPRAGPLVTGVFVPLVCFAGVFVVVANRSIDATAAAGDEGPGVRGRQGAVDDVVDGARPTQGAASTQKIGANPRYCEFCGSELPAFQESSMCPTCGAPLENE